MWMCVLVWRVPCYMLCVSVESAVLCVYVECCVCPNHTLPHSLITSAVVQAPSPSPLVTCTVMEYLCWVGDGSMVTRGGGRV